MRTAESEWLQILHKRRIEELISEHYGADSGNYEDVLKGVAGASASDAR